MADEDVELQDLLVLRGVWSNIAAILQKQQQMLPGEVQYTSLLLLCVSMQSMLFDT